MTLNAIKQAIYSLYLTNSFGFRLARTDDSLEKKRLRHAYSVAQLKTLNITKLKIKRSYPKRVPTLW